MAKSHNYVPLETFLLEYKAAVRDGLTTAQLAERLGMKPGTVQQRIYDLRKKLAPESIELPRLKSARTPVGSTLVERAKAILCSDEEPTAKKAKPAKKKAEVVVVAEEEEVLAEEPSVDQEDQDALDAIFN